MDPIYVRGRAFNLTLLAAAHAQQGHTEEACRVGQESLKLVRNLNSARAIRYLVGVADHLEKAADDAVVAAFKKDVCQVVAAA